MNRAWMLGSTLALGLGAVAAGAITEAPARAQDSTGWLGSFEAAQAAARQSGKPIFLVFR
jgi:hypothetical protein